MLTALVVFLIVDAVENIDNFVDAKVATDLIIKFYIFYIPYIFYLTYPVGALLATLFTIGGLTMNNELIAIKVAGVSFMRPLVLLLVATSLLALGVYYMGETVVPVANKQRMDIERYEVKKLPRENRAKHGRIYVQVGKDTQLYIGNYKAATREAFNIRLLNLEDGHITSRIDAEKMVWRDQEWHVQGGSEMKFDHKKMNALGQSDISDSLDFKLVSFQKKNDYTISGKGLRPDEFEKVLTRPEEMNTEELHEFIDRFDRIGGDTKRWEVDLLSKKAQPVAAIIIVLFGAPIAAVRRRGGTALGFGLSLFICFIYFGIIQVGKNLGYSGILEPWLASWLGNIIFGMLGLGLLIRSNV